VINLGKIKAAHSKFLKAHQTMVERELEAAGQVGADHPRQHATFKHRTHALERATKYRVVRTARGHLVRILNPKKYAPYLEFGTRAHTIRARGRALRFVAGGSTVFAKMVRHPGTRPYKFLYHAVSAAYRVAGPNIEAGMARIAKKF
jgi:hypothetical protein